MADFNLVNFSSNAGSSVGLLIFNIMNRICVDVGSFFLPVGKTISLKMFLKH